MRRLSPYAISILAHVLFLAVLFWIPFTSSLRDSTQTAQPVPLEWVEIPAPAKEPEINAQKNAQKNSETSSQRKSHAKLKTSQPIPKLALRDLRLKRPNDISGNVSAKDVAEDVSRETSNNASEDSANFEYDDPMSYLVQGNGFDAFGTDRGFIEAVYRRVDGRILFDTILAQYNHFGSVYVEFVVRADGTLIADSIRASADDGILQVHSLRALRRGLMEPLDPNLHLKNKQTLRLKARFQFVRRPGNGIDGPAIPIGARALSFYRSTSQRPIARSLRGHLINGGIGTDLFQVYDSWAAYLKSKEHARLEYDPFAGYKADPDYTL